MSLKIKELVKSATPEIETLKELLKDAKESHWGLYNNITYNDVICTYNNRGFIEAKELIRQSDIIAYHIDEACNGNI